MDLRSTVTRWVNIRIDEFVEKEMGSSIEVKRNNFKATIKTFFDWIKIVKKEVNKSVKSARQKAIEIYKAAYVKNALVFEIDDKLIPGINILASTNIILST